MTTPQPLNGVRTHRPDLSQYTYATEQIGFEVSRWLEGVPTGKVSRNLMLSGPTGLGKTTLAQALCGALGVQPRDIQEINCADLRGIDAARQLLNSTLAFGPSAGNYRVLILDEAHQMTQDAQQAFLTPLEQLSPKHIVIVCSSNPELLLPQFRGRFYQIKLEAYSEEKIVDILMNLPEAPAPDVAVTIAALARGNPRAAIAYYERGVTAADSETISQEVYRIEHFMLALIEDQPVQAVMVLGQLRQDETVAFVNKVSTALEQIWLKKSGAKLMVPPELRGIVDKYTGKDNPRITRYGSWLYEQMQGTVFKHPNHINGIVMRYFDFAV